MKKENSSSLIFYPAEIREIKLFSTERIQKWRFVHPGDTSVLFRRGIIEMRMTQGYKRESDSRRFDQQTLTFVSLWYKDTDMIKNGFHPTTCRGRSIKAKQMKFFIDVFWIRKRGRNHGSTEEALLRLFYRLLSQSFFFNDPSSLFSLF